MCRLLVVRSTTSFAITAHLEKFAEISKNSKEYQGHGWGCAYRDEVMEWKRYKNINPVWEDDFEQFPKTTCLVAHARSAFEDRDIVIENNMPFFDGKYVYVFNGELRGVRIREKGRIGAEKIFNYIKRFDKGDPAVALEKAVHIIKKRTTYIRGMNIIIVDDKGIYVSSTFNEDQAYFTLHYTEANPFIVCSEPYQTGRVWKQIPNNSMRQW